MYSSGDAITSIVFMLVVAAVSLVVLYYVIRVAVTEGMKNHTRWHVANRAEIEEKYGKKKPPRSRTRRTSDDDRSLLEPVNVPIVLGSIDVEDERSRGLVGRLESPAV